MTINIDDWSPVEMKAQAVELAHIETPKVPTPTTSQQLNFTTIRCAQLQAKVHRMQGAMLEALMWSQAGESQRAQEVLNRALLDL